MEQHNLVFQPCQSLGRKSYFLSHRSERGVGNLQRSIPGTRDRPWPIVHAPKMGSVCEDRIYLGEEQHQQNYIHVLIDYNLNKSPRSRLVCGCNFKLHWLVGAAQANGTGRAMPLAVETFSLTGDGTGC